MIPGSSAGKERIDHVSATFLFSAQGLSHAVTESMTPLLVVISQHDTITCSYFTNISPAIARRVL